MHQAIVGGVAALALGLLVVMSLDFDPEVADAAEPNPVSSMVTD